MRNAIEVSGILQSTVIGTINFRRKWLAKKHVTYSTSPIIGTNKMFQVKRKNEVTKCSGWNIT